MLRGSCQNIRFYHLQEDALDIVPVFNSDAASLKNSRDILQPIMASDIECNGKLHRVLTLSDTGSTIAFLLKEFAEKLNMTPAGMWEGSIETLYSVQKDISKIL